MAVSPDRLKGSALFKDFTPTGIGILAAIATERVVLAGKPLFAEGGPSDACFIVVEGRLKVSVKGSDGGAVSVGSLGMGEHLGELSLLGSEERLCTATAETDSKVVEIRGADFQELQKQKPQACLKLMMAIATEFGRKVSDNRDALKQVLARAVPR